MQSKHDPNDAVPNIVLIPGESSKIPSNDELSLPRRKKLSLRNRRESRRRRSTTTSSSSSNLPRYNDETGDGKWGDFDEDAKLPAVSASRRDDRRSTPHQEPTTSRRWTRRRRPQEADHHELLRSDDDNSTTQLPDRTVRRRGMARRSSLDPNLLRAQEDAEAKKKTLRMLRRRSEIQSSPAVIFVASDDSIGNASSDDFGTSKGSDEGEAGAGSTTSNNDDLGGMMPLSDLCAMLIPPKIVRNDNTVDRYRRRRSL